MLVMTVMLCLALTPMSGCAKRAVSAEVSPSPEATPSATIEPTPAPEVSVRVRAWDGSEELPTKGRIAVVVINGYATNITAVDSTGAEYSGAVVEGAWTPDKPLPINETLTLTVTLKNLNEETVTQTVQAPTVTGSVEKFRLRFTDMTVGTAMPAVVQFDKAVPEEYRPEVERNVKVQITPEQEGAWGWQKRGTQLMFRPKEYWQPGTEIIVTANLVGVPAGEKAFFNRKAEGTMTIGPSRYATVEIDKYRTTMYENGKQVAQFPSTAGNSQYVTRSGKKVITEKHQHIIMDGASIGIPKSDPDYYYLHVYWAMRVTDTGEFVHAAPWSAGSHGWANVSHGCVGMSTENAKRLYNFLNIGDVIIFTGSNRGYNDNEGIAVWQYSWEEWQTKSALK